MYVAPKQASKQLAGRPPYNPPRIIRKLRLALLQRTCRLPIGTREGRSPAKLTVSGGVYGVSGTGGSWETAPSRRAFSCSSRPGRQFSGHFAVPVSSHWQSLPIVREASDQTDSTCVLYLGCRPTDALTGCRGPRPTVSLACLARFRCRLAKNRGDGNRVIGGRFPHQAFACMRPAAGPPGKVKSRCPHAKIQLIRCATC
jgi:hypothetical protein